MRDSVSGILGLSSGIGMLGDGILMKDVVRFR